MKIAVTVKSKLKYDGRVLSQLITLGEQFPNWSFTLFLVSDGGGPVTMPANVYLKEIKLLTRDLPKSAFFQAIKMIEFALRFNLSLFWFKPDILHVHDETLLLGPVLFSKLSKKTIIIYDDHELRYLDEKLNTKDKMMRSLEENIFKRADIIIMANSYRKDFGIEKSLVINSQKEKIHIIENYPLINFDQKNVEIPERLKNRELKYLLHQSVAINKERGSDILLETIKKLPKKWRLVIIGVSKDKFDSFIKEHDELRKQTIFIGFVPYDELENYWTYVDGAVIFYQTDKINNRLCAPNRLFLAANNGIPLIVNKNPVLQDFIKKYKTGISVEDNYENIETFFNNYDAFEQNAKQLKGKFEYSSQAEKLISIYNSLAS
jgi:hypothetical protein